MKTNNQITELKAQIEKLQDQLNTETYCKRAMHAFIIENGMSKEYYDSFRYKYAGNNIKAFSQSLEFEPYLTALFEANNDNGVKTVINKLVTAGEIKLAAEVHNKFIAFKESACNWA